LPHFGNLFRSPNLRYFLNESLANSRRRRFRIYGPISAFAVCTGGVLGAVFCTRNPDVCEGDRVLSNTVSEQLQDESALLRQIIDFFPIGLTVRSQKMGGLSCATRRRRRASSAVPSLRSRAVQEICRPSKMKPHAGRVTLCRSVRFQPLRQRPRTVQLSGRCGPQAGAFALARKRSCSPPRSISRSASASNGNWSALPISTD